MPGNIAGDETNKRRMTAVPVPVIPNKASFDQTSSTSELMTTERDLMNAVYAGRSDWTEAVGSGRTEGITGLSPNPKPGSSAITREAQSVDSCDKNTDDDTAADADQATDDDQTAEERESNVSEPKTASIDIETDDVRKPLPCPVTML